MAIPHALFQPVEKEPKALAPTIAQQIAQRFIVGRGVDHAHDHHATARAGRGEDQVDIKVKQGPDGSTHVGIAGKGPDPALAYLPFVKLHGLPERLLLRTEGSIEARRIDAHRRREIGELRALISPGPE